MQQPRAVSQRYFVAHIKELQEPVKVTIQTKNGTGAIETLGLFFPFASVKEVENWLKGQNTTNQ